MHLKKKVNTGSIWRLFPTIIITQLMSQNKSLGLREMNYLVEKEKSNRNIVIRFEGLQLKLLIKIYHQGRCNFKLLVTLSQALNSHLYGACQPNFKDFFRSLPKVANLIMMIKSQKVIFQCQFHWQFQLAKLAG